MHPINLELRNTFKNYKYMKTLKQYEKSEKGLHEFLRPLDRIDWPLYEHILCGWVPSHFDDGVRGQAGECNHSKDGIWYYDTVSTIDGKYYYLGLMPSFDPAVYYSYQAEEFRRED